jgi:hypothetical protein
MTKMTVFPRPEIYKEGNFAVEITGLMPNVAKIIKKSPSKLAVIAQDNLKDFLNPLAMKFVTMLYPVRESNPNVPFTVEERNSQIANLLEIPPRGKETPWQFFIDSYSKIVAPVSYKAGILPPTTKQKLQSLYTGYVLDQRKKGMGAVDDTAQILEYERVMKEKQALQMKLIAFLAVATLSVMYFYRKK